MTDSTKDTNPKDAVGVRKWRQFSAVSGTVLAEVGVGMLEGARKYGRHNYRVAGIRASVYYDAAMGHLIQWWEGEDFDADSGLSHVTKAICSLFVLRDALIQQNIVDDRPPKADLTAARDALQAAVDDIFDRWPESVPAYVQERDDGDLDNIFADDWQDPDEAAQSMFASGKATISDDGLLTIHPEPGETNYVEMMERAKAELSLAVGLPVDVVNPVFESVRPRPHPRRDEVSSRIRDYMTEGRPSGTHHVICALKGLGIGAKKLSDVPSNMLDQFEALLAHESRGRYVPSNL